MARILKRKFDGGPLDGCKRLLNADVTEYKELDAHIEHTERISVYDHYELNSDGEFYYVGKF